MPIVRNSATLATTKGTVVAELDTERYEVAPQQAEAQVAAARAQAVAVQTEIEKVIPQQLGRLVQPPPIRVPVTRSLRAGR